MGFREHALRLVKRRLLMLFPERHIHVAVSLPVIGLRNKRPVVAPLICLHPGQQKLVPLVEMHENIPEIFVPFPVRFLFRAG